MVHTCTSSCRPPLTRRHRSPNPPHQLFNNKGSVVPRLRGVGAGGGDVDGRAVALGVFEEGFDLSLYLSVSWVAGGGGHGDISTRRTPPEAIQAPTAQVGGSPIMNKNNPTPTNAKPAARTRPAVPATGTAAAVAAAGRRGDAAAGAAAVAGSVLMVTWEKPAKSEANVWVNRLSPVMEQPGEWARVGAFPVGIRSHSRSANSPVVPTGRWEFVTRIHDRLGRQAPAGTLWFYARYLGPLE